MTDSCVVEGTDIILNIEFGRQILDFAMIDAIHGASVIVTRKILFEGGERVLPDSEIPWEIYSHGLLISATTPGPGPRILTWDVLAFSLHGLSQCGHRERKYKEMYTSIWDMEGKFYGTLSLRNRHPHGFQ